MRLFIGNLKRQVTESELVQLLSQYGEISSARLGGSRYSSDPNIFAFVDIESAACAEAAIAGLNNTMYLEQVITVTEAKDNSKWKYPGQ